MSLPAATKSPAAKAPLPVRPEAVRLKDLSPQQWRSGIAAWLGWMFDGLDMHLYTLVAAPFVMTLVHATAVSDFAVKEKSSFIQAAFLVGWALGGGFFGRLGDVLGRSRSLALTILTYAMFTGLSSIAQNWWQLMIFRFVAALGIGGEWAVGSSLLSETWPKRWRPWIAAVLQTGVNLGVLLACAANYFLKPAPLWPRSVFLVGILPALLVFWIRKSVPEPEEWAAEKQKQGRPPGIGELFKGEVLRITVCTIIVCATSLTAWWGFMFWNVQHLRSLPSVQGLSPQEQEGVATMGLFLPIGISILGNFFAGWLARLLGYRKAIAVMSIGFFLSFMAAYYKPRDHHELLIWVSFIGFFSGMFGLFTMFLPPLFPTLLRTTGAGFCYNIGRIAAAAGTIVFGLYAKVGDFRVALLWAGFLFIPTIIVSQLLPEPRSLHE